MVNYFRQLTLPWLVALIAMMSFTGLWFQLEAQAQQRIQVEQVATMLQFSVRPLLKNKDADLLKAQLNNMRFASVVPLTAIAIYTQQHRLLVATERSEALISYKADVAANEFSVQPHQNQLIAVQPLVTNSTDGLTVAEPQYYMLLMFEPATAYTVWLIPIAIVGLIGIVVLFLLQSSLTQLAQRQHTDVSLITHKLNQLRHGQLNVSVSEELVAELAPLKSAVNELAQHLAEEAAKARLGGQQQQLQAESLQQQQTLLQQQFDLLRQRQGAQEQMLQHRLLSFRQLQQQQAELEETEFTQLLFAQLCLLQLELDPAPQEETPLRLSTFLAAQVPLLQQQLRAKNIDLQLFEGAHNSGYEISCSAQQLTMLLPAMLQLGSRAKSVSELTLRVKLDTNPSQSALHISITGNGDGISSRVRQLLSHDDTRSLQWHESDIGILMVLKRQLQASITVQSLDGLGCTIALVLPVTTVTPLNQNRLAHLLLFDNQPGSLSERAQSLAPLTEYLAKCSDLAELQQKSKQFAYEIALIMLPEPAELSQWCNELQELCRRSRVLCYAAKAQLAVWREALQLPVQEMPFCLEDVLSARPAQIQYPRLLVVDDNATNLAFIRVLMKEQPVQLYTANCGQEALKLCQQQLFDVILLDIQLPDIAGTEVAQQLRQLAEYQHTPILAFTAHALEDEVNAFIRAGMNDVIFKPLEAMKVELILRWCSVGKTDDISQ